MVAVVILTVLPVVANVLVLAGAVFKMPLVLENLFINPLLDLEFIVVGAIVVVTKFAVAASYSAVRSSDVAATLLIEALVGGMLLLLINISIEVKVGVNANGFVVFMKCLEVSVRTPLKEFNRWAAFDCRPTTALDCDSPLQAWMPSYHV